MTGEPERTYLFAASLETGESFVVDGFPAEIRKSGWYGNRAEYEAVIGGSVELRSTAVPAPSSSFLVASWPDSPILNEGLGNWITWRYRDRRYFVYGEELDPGFRWVLVQDPVELFASGFENGVEEWSWVFP